MRWAESRGTALPSRPRSFQDGSGAPSSDRAAPGDVEVLDGDEGGGVRDDAVALGGVLAEQVHEGPVRLQGGLDADLQQRAVLWVEGGVAEHLGVHLAEALEAGDVALDVGPQLCQDLVAVVVVAGPEGLL